MDNMKLRQLTPEQERFLGVYFTEQDVDRTKVFDLVSALAGVPYLRDVRITLEGGLISWRGLKVVADMDTDEFSRTMTELRDLNDEQREQRLQARAVLAYERLEQALARPGLFQHVGVKDARPFGYETKLENCVVQGSVTLDRNEGTKYKVDLTVPVELRVYRQASSE